MTICPNSTPRLNATNGTVTPVALVATPRSRSTVANPKPWISPNRNVISHRPLGPSACTKFSTPT